MAHGRLVDCPVERQSVALIEVDWVDGIVVIVLLSTSSGWCTARGIGKVRLC